MRRFPFRPPTERTRLTNSRAAWRPQHGIPKHRRSFKNFPLKRFQKWFIPSSSPGQKAREFVKQHLPHWLKPVPPFLKEWASTFPGYNNSGNALILLFAAAFLLLPSLVRAQDKPIRRILILNEVGISYPGINLINKEVRTALQDLPYRMEFYVEYLETTLFPDPADQQRFRDFYIAKYKNRKPDLIVTVGPSPLRFIAETHEKSFPGVPVIFCIPQGNAPATPALDSDFTGVENDMAPAETLDAALRLVAETQNVVVVSGSSPFDHEEQAEVQEQLKGYADRLNISYLTDLAMPLMVERLRHLPNHTIVLLTTIGQDGAGRRFISTEAGPMIAAAANVPVFSLYDVYLNHGEVGGYLASLREQGKIAGEMAVRILGGEKPQNLPRVGRVTSYMFDWRALKRWGLDENKLPPGSIVLNRDPTVWEMYHWYITGGISLMLLEALLISGLMRQRARRRKAESALTYALETAQESEERFRLVANTAPVMIWMSGPDKLCNYFNQPWLEFTGRPLDAQLGDGWVWSVHPDDMKECLDTYVRFFDRRESFTMQYRMRRNDGTYRWVLDTGVPRFNSDDSFAGYIGSCIDITERKLAEEALSTVSRRLIDAQEQERTRIARELHDDINQRIAMVGIEIDMLEQPPSGLCKETRRRMREISRHLSEIGSEIQAISHRLHSSKLEFLGLVVACRSFCREVATRHKVTVDFGAEGIPPEVSQEVSLCLFRVLQESLNNAIKHSGAQHFQARLRRTSREIQLTVRDSGIGLDTEAAKNSQGLGLVSMRERVGLLKGTLLIASKPMEGTEIVVCIPVVAEGASQMSLGAA